METAGVKGDVAEDMPVGRVVAGAAVVALHHHPVADSGTELIGQIAPEPFVHIRSECGLVAEVVHHPVETHRRADVITLLLVVVDGVDKGKGILQRLEVAVEDGVAAGALLFDEALDVVVGIVAPAADADFQTADRRGGRLQRPDIIDIVGIGLSVDITAVFADDLVVGLQGSVAHDVDVEKDCILETGVAEVFVGMLALAPDMAAAIDSG